MPYGLQYGRVLQGQDNFFLFGGKATGLGSTDTILEFDNVQESWILRSDVMAFRRESAYVMEVDAEKYC